VDGREEGFSCLEDISWAGSRGCLWQVLNLEKDLLWRDDTFVVYHFSQSKKHSKLDSIVCMIL
jgi:hypothetical protein